MNNIWMIFCYYHPRAAPLKRVGAVLKSSFVPEVFTYHPDKTQM